jgi:hypothetical protein
MSTWVDFTILALVLAVFWFVLPSVGPRHTEAFIADRNAAWAATHSDAIRRLLESRWFAWSCYALGVLNLLGLVSVQLGGWFDTSTDDHWQALWSVTVLSLIAGAVYHYAMYRIFLRWLSHHVPLAERREATLAPRRVEQYVTPRIRYSTYAFVAAVPAGWLAVGAFGRAPEPQFWSELGDLAVLSAVFSVLFSFLARVSVARPQQMMDRALGPRFRGIEVRAAFAVQLVPPLVGVLALGQYVVGATPLAIQRGIQLGLMLLLFWAGLKQIRAMRRASLPPRSAAT